MLKTVSRTSQQSLRETQRNARGNGGHRQHIKALFFYLNHTKLEFNQKTSKGKESDLCHLVRKK